MRYFNDPENRIGNKKDKINGKEIFGIRNGYPDKEQPYTKNKKFKFFFFRQF